MSTPLPPPGYYADPTGAIRWWDGTQWGPLASEIAAVQQQTGPSGQQPAEQRHPPSRSGARAWIWIGVCFAMVLITFLILGWGTERWELVVEPEHPETYATVEVETGEYVVTMHTVNPCMIGQNWNECVGLYVESYAAACAGKPLDSPSVALCDEYLRMIDDLKAQGLDDTAVVEGLGDWGSLTAEPIVEERQVSNQDYRPAVTREAVCVLGLFGECRWHHGFKTVENVPEAPDAPEGVLT